MKMDDFRRGMELVTSLGGRSYSWRGEEIIDLSYTGVADEHMPWIYAACLGDVTSLYLDGTRVSDSGVQYFRGSDKDLMSLSLSDTELTTKGMESFAGMKSVTVWLSRTRVDDGVCQWLGCCEEIESIALDNTRVSDDGVRALRHLKCLTELGLSGTCVTDNVVDVVCRIELLKYLWIAKSKVSPAAIEGLQSQRPDMKVVY